MKNAHFFSLPIALALILQPPIASASLTLTSGNDTTLKGANLQGGDIALSVGNDLSIISLQDTRSSKGMSMGMSASVSSSTSAKTGETSYGQSGGINGSSSKGSTAWVGEQSGITGSESVAITV